VLAYPPEEICQPGLQLKLGHAFFLHLLYDLSIEPIHLSLIELLLLLFLLLPSHLHATLALSVLHILHLI